MTLRRTGKGRSYLCSSEVRIGVNFERRGAVIARPKRSESGSVSLWPRTAPESNLSVFGNIIQVALLIVILMATRF